MRNLTPLQRTPPETPPPKVPIRSSLLKKKTNMIPVRQKRLAPNTIKQMQTPSLKVPEVSIDTNDTNMKTITPEPENELEYTQISPAQGWINLPKGGWKSKGMTINQSSDELSDSSSTSITIARKRIVKDTNKESDENSSSQALMEAKEEYRMEQKLKDPSTCNLMWDNKTTPKNNNNYPSTFSDMEQHIETEETQEDAEEEEWIQRQRIRILKKNLEI